MAALRAVLRENKTEPPQKAKTPEREYARALLSEQNAAPEIENFL